MRNAGKSRVGKQSLVNVKEFIHEKDKRKNNYVTVCESKSTDRKPRTEWDKSLEWEGIGV